MAHGASPHQQQVSSWTGRIPDRQRYTMERYTMESYRHYLSMTSMATSEFPMDWEESLQPIDKHPSHSHPHIHSEESSRRLVNRLSRIEGHIRGIKMMIAEDRPCPDVLVQIAAVRGALDRVARMVLDEHLTECISRAAREGNIEAELDELRSALDRFL